MAINEVIVTIITMVFITNIVLSEGLGICPVISSNKDKPLVVGGIITITMVLVNLILYPINVFVIIPYGLDYLLTMIYVPVIFIVGWLINLVISKFSPKLKNDLGCNIRLVTCNCAILGIAIIIFDDGLGFVETITTAIGAGLGFMLALVTFATTKEKIEKAQLIPESFKGVPVQLFSLAIIALVFTCIGEVINGLLTYM